MYAGYKPPRKKRKLPETSNAQEVADPMMELLDLELIEQELNKKVTSFVTLQALSFLFNRAELDLCVLQKAMRLRPLRAPLSVPHPTIQCQISGL